MTDTASPFQWSAIVVQKRHNIDLGHTTNSRVMPPPVISGAPTTRGDTNNGRNSNHRGAGAVFVTLLLKLNVDVSMMQPPSALAKQGDRELAQARNLAIEHASWIAVNDCRIMGDHINL